MKRSDMTRQMMEYWLGLFPNEDYYGEEFQDSVEKRMGELLGFLEYKGMKPPVTEICPVLFTEKQTWEKE